MTTAEKVGFTPGPWTVGDRVATATTKYALHIMGKKGIPAHTFGNSEETVQANARLIASAPDGFALAEHILALETDPYLQGHPEWEAFLNEAMVLIRKVKGEEL